MKNIWTLFLCFILSGCVSSIENTAKSKPDPLEDLTKIKHVQLGMSLSDVKSIMGDSLIVGYNIDNAKNIIEPIKLNSPYRSDQFSAKGKQYTVLYYFTHVNNPDGIIADDELMPLIFEGDKLIGKDKDFLFRIKQAK